MDDVAGACLLMQIVDVLRDDRHVVAVLQLCDEAVAGVGLCRKQFLAKPIIEIVHIHRIHEPAFVASNLLYRFFFPESVGTAERLEAALYRHAGTCQKYYFFHWFNAPAARFKWFKAPAARVKWLRHG